ncbi:hypothetical protein [Glaciibacter psychrotolerans]|uniref:Uncharacterized protein n=1 Tax=Glaciibacter psychrotolerans TaxID=670054 RepID=A0A7Z0EGH2_9MICO|nr:hypothetical protein [Leifsonia psychrotolerans]NYJ21219.1 hypothetical protein [Leifsonia psychrotolerans]
MGTEDAHEDIVGLPDVIDLSDEAGHCVTQGGVAQPPQIWTLDDGVLVGVVCVVVT